MQRKISFSAFIFLFVSITPQITMKKMISMLSPLKITAFQQMFLEQRANLLSPKLFSPVDDVSADEVDIAQSLVLNEMMERLSLRDKENFFKINDALKRIEEGSFGLCEECEEPIAEKRLQAIPCCTTCISCAEQQERLAKQYRKV